MTFRAPERIILHPECEHCVSRAHNVTGSDWDTWQKMTCAVCGDRRGYHGYKHPHPSILIVNDCKGFSVLSTESMAQGLRVIIEDLEHV